MVKKYNLYSIKNELGKLECVKVPFSFGERDLGIGAFPNQFCFSIQVSLRGIDDFKLHNYLKIKNITLQLTLDKKIFAKNFITIRALSSYGDD